MTSYFPGVKLQQAIITAINNNTDLPTAYDRASTDSPQNIILVNDLSYDLYGTFSDNAYIARVTLHIYGDHIKGKMGVLKTIELLYSLFHRNTRSISDTLDQWNVIDSELISADVDTRARGANTYAMGICEIQIFISDKEQSI